METGVVSGSARYKPTLREHAARPDSTTGRRVRLIQRACHTLDGRPPTDRPPTTRQPARLNPHDSPFGFLPIKLNYPHVSRPLSYIL
jgi:hypothetical protein